ncbi:MAG: type I-E CRISPR-associated protein Cas6/Cse3/CasE [Microbacteriaceae bacterium]|nr:MAG: type I-E CRISPR-associated protein Cas6/Cse3/CasE [Microbacteriaceae bacterium]
MFISRMAINGARRQSRFLLGSPQAMHAAVLASFPPGTLTEGDAGRVLWRIDKEPSRATWLYVVSPGQPDMTHLIEQAGWPTQAAWETRDYLPFLGRIRTGQQWAFRLVGNPVHSVNLESGESKRLGHITAVQQAQWLRQRGENSGFALTQTEAGADDLVVSEREKRSFRRESAQVTLSTARFDGRLEVRDASELRHALTHGIGRAKGYGCGLLTLVPVRSDG